jgi:hypothetical protein
MSIITTDPDASEVDELRQRFKLVCRACDSDDVAINIEDGINYGGQTGYQEGSITIGCNACKRNDFWMSI